MARTALFRPFRLMLAAAALMAAASLALAFMVRRPAAADWRTAPAIRFDTIALPEATGISDFVLADTRLYLLDRTSSRIHVLRQTEHGWQPDFQFGRRGSGPGELSAATGLTMIHDTIVITDRHGLSYFRSTGEYIGQRMPRLPCAALHPLQLHGELLLLGECPSADTIVARLYALRAGRYQAVASAPRFTISGRFGSHFYALRGASEANDHILFGIGDKPCVTMFDGRSSRERCGRLERYQDAPPPSLAGRRRTGLARDWPDHLPYLVDRVSINQEPALWRPVTHDTLLLQSIAGVNLGRARLEGFIGCRAAGCLWALHRTQGMRILWLPAARLDSLGSAL